MIWTVTVKDRAGVVQDELAFTLDADTAADAARLAKIRFESEGNWVLWLCVVPKGTQTVIITAEKVKDKQDREAAGRAAAAARVAAMRAAGVPEHAIRRMARGQGE